MNPLVRASIDGGGPSVPIVAWHGASVREEAINMPEDYDLYAPSRARCQARAALTRGRRTKKTAAPVGEIPGQLSIYDVLAEQSAEQAVEGGDQS